MSFWTAFGVAALGGLITEFLPIHALRRVPRSEWPEWVSTRSYWTVSAVGFLIWGAIAGGYATTTAMTWYLAANVGAAWPSIINGVANAKAPLQAAPGQVD
jgi:hypothetical protein